MAENAIHWAMNPELVNIFGLSVRYYGLLFAMGLILSGVIIARLYKKEEIEQEHLEVLVIYAVPLIFFGARLGHCLFYEPSYYLTRPLEMFLPIQLTEQGNYVFTGYEGLASHGGLLGLVIAGIIQAKKTGVPFLITADLVSIAAPLGGAFIRLANLMNSEIIGKPATVPWAFIFKEIDSVPRHPAQLYEAIAYLMLFVILITLYSSSIKMKVRPGFFLGLAMSLVFLVRFLVEFVKESQVPFEEGMILNMGQLLSIPFIVAGMVLVVIALRSIWAQR